MLGIFSIYLKYFKREGENRVVWLDIWKLKFYLRNRKWIGSVIGSEKCDDWFIYFYNIGLKWILISVKMY